MDRITWYWVIKAVVNRKRFRVCSCDLCEVFYNVCGENGNVNVNNIYPLFAIDNAE